MNERQEISKTSGNKTYMFVVGMYMGTSHDFRYMINAELRGEEKTTYFLLAILNPVYVYAQGTDVDTVKLYRAAVDGIAEYLENNDWKEGVTYYGEMLQDGRFYIDGTDKPTWEDGNWGQKANI